MSIHEHFNFVSLNIKSKCPNVYIHYKLFHRNLMSKRGDIKLPPRSLDLTPPGLFDKQCVNQQAAELSGA